MDKHLYNATSLKNAVEAFERGYGISSADFYRAHVDGDEERIEHIARRHRATWAMFLRTIDRLSGGDSFARQVERDLELV